MCYNNSLGMMFGVYGHTLWLVVHVCVCTDAQSSAGVQMTDSNVLNIILKV